MSSSQDHTDMTAAQPRRRVLTALAAFGALGSAAALTHSGDGEERPLELVPVATGGSTEFHWANTVADLRTLVGTPTTQPPVAGKDIVVVQGYARPGDGGGGVFYWDLSTTDADNGGTVFVPTAPPRTGCWKRIFEGPLDVRWFGARGDGTSDDTIAIQNALNAVVEPAASIAGDGRGNTVVLPPGRYRIQAQGSNTYALLINKNVVFQGTGGPPYGASVLLLARASEAILVEGVPARATILRNLAIYPAPAGQGGRDGILVHTGSVSIEDCYITGMKRHGILIESGTVGSLEGSSTLPTGTYINSNFWRLSRVVLTTCGAMNGQPGYGTPAGGSGIRAHGSDTNGGLANACFGQTNNITFYDGTLGGGTWIACYSEASGIGFKSDSPGAPTFLGCFTEDITGGEIANQTALVVGGTLAATSNVVQRIGQLRARLKFNASVGTPAVTYGALIPSEAHNAVLQFWRNTANWVLAYTDGQSGSAPYPYLLHSWRWRREADTTAQPDPNGAPFGWTDAANPRGVALPFIANPLLNTLRRWTWKQTGITLNPGANVIYLFGGRTNLGNAQFAQAAKAFTPLSDTRVTVDVQLATLADLTAADIQVGAHALVAQDNTGGQYAVKIYNNGGAAVVATLVWHFEAFVTNGLTIG